jgi:HK97 family phage major capsid protein
MDAAQFNAVANQSAGEEIAFMVNDDIVNGTGTGGPQGVLQSGALVTVSFREDVNKISHADVVSMWQRMLPRNKKNAAWFCNSDVMPALNKLYFTGTTSVLSPYINYSPEGVLMMFGKPVIETEFNPALGTSGGAAGDLLLADFSDYLFWDKGDVQAATSIHIAFLTDEQAFRFVYRCDGQSAWASPITPYKAGATVLTQSAFVVLSAASS